MNVAVGVTTVTLLSVLTIGLADNQTLTCEAGNFSVGEDASVTCLFHRDVGRTMHHIYVTKYSFDTANNLTQALICFRLHTKELECKVADGYSFDNVVSDNLTLAIPEVKRRFAGRYSCALVPPEDIPTNTCDLKVNGTALTCQAGSFTEGEMAAVNCYFHKNIEKSIHHIYIIRYPYNATENSTSALTCFRLHTKQLECRTEAGYKFNGIVSHKLTLEIPEVRKRFAGRYSCQIFPPDGVPLDTCDLNVKGGPSPVTTQGDAHDSGLSFANILLYSTMIFVMVTILVVVVFVLCVRRRRALRSYRKAANAAAEFQMGPLVQYLPARQEVGCQWEDEDKDVMVGLARQNVGDDEEVDRCMIQLDSGRTSEVEEEDKDESLGSDD